MGQRIHSFQKLIIICISFLFFNSSLYSQWKLELDYSRYEGLRASFLNPDTGFYSYSEWISPGQGGLAYIDLIANGHYTNVYKMDATGSGITPRIEYLSTINKNCSFAFLYDGVASHLLKSTDLGKTWDSKTALLYCSPGSMFVLSEKAVYLGFKGYYNRIAKYTEDTIINLIVSDTINYDNNKIYFVNEQRGYLITSNKFNENLVLATVDSGYNWSCIYKSTFSINDILFTSNNIGFLLNNNKILRTVDNGINWNEVNSNNTNELNDLYFINDSIGYCVGNSGNVLKTEDSGQNWCNTAFINSTIDLLNIQMFDTVNGFILGSNNCLYARKEKIEDINDYSRIKSFNFYPNPCSETLYYNNLDSSSTVFYIYTLNQVLIKVIQSNEMNKIDFSNIPVGIYIVFSVSGKNVYLDKIIKK